MPRSTAGSKASHYHGAVMPNAVLDWDRIDTVLVDLDSTLLDLAFDNFFWLKVQARAARGSSGR